MHQQHWFGLLATMVFWLVACGGGGGGGSAAAPVAPPAAPALNVNYSFKNFHFSWGVVSGATHYKLFENPDGVSGFTQLGADIAAPATSSDVDVAVHMRDWANARYLLEACNSGGCTASSAINTVLAASLIGYFKASNTDTLDYFGYSVALSADGNTLAVGAYGESSNATGIGGDEGNNSAGEAGAVYVFARSGHVWTQQAYLKASNAGAADNFGRTLALSANGNTLAVGAPYEDSNATGIGGAQNDNSATGAGAVYVFTRSVTTWTQQAYVKASNTDALDSFGRSVALSADGNTLAVGAPGEASSANLVGGDETDNSAVSAGAVYVFQRLSFWIPPAPPVVTWSQQAYVKAFNSESFDQFGWAVALSGDGNTLAVGVPGEDSDATGIGGDGLNNNADGAGAVRIFARSSGVWTHQAYIKASNTDALDTFGRSVALSGDGNTLAVGAEGEASNTNLVNGNQSNNSAPGAGAVYVFTQSGTAWSQQAYVKASNSGSPDRLGASVALSSDGNTLAVGAYGEAGNGAASDANGVGGDQNDNSAGNAGAVFVFTRGGTAWTQKNYVKALLYAEADDFFGHALALSGDGSTLVVGAIGEDSNGTGTNSGAMSNNSTESAGAVYVY